MNGRTKFAVALSVETDPVAAATEAAERVRRELGGATPTLTVVFATPRLCTDPWALVDTVHAVLAPQHLVGCTSEAIIGEGREIEDSPGLSVWSAVLPDALVETFRLTSSPDGDGVVGWPDHLRHTDTPVLALADPFTLRVDAMIEQHNAGDGPAVIGGLASGGRRAGEHVIFVDRDVHFEGGVLVELAGASIVPVVSQGCAPIGPDMVITAGGGPVVAELAGMDAFAKISSVVDDLDASERELLRQPLLAGIVIDENQPDYGRGDFLVRGIHGRDADTGAIYVGEHVRVGQTFRLHVRDAASAHDDLYAALRDARQATGSLTPAGGLIFTCNGRGLRMFGTPDHDATAVATELGVPAAGMFCNGEIGPVGGKTFIHGFTATMALFLDDKNGPDTLPSE